MPIEMVKAKRLMPSVILPGGNTSLDNVIVAEPHTEYTAPHIQTNDDERSKNWENEKARER